MRIRKFRVEDLGEIMDIENLAFPKSPYDIRVFIYYSTLLPENFIVCENESGRVVGYIIFEKDGHVISIAVHPRWRRRGIGTELMKEVFKRANGKARIEVRESNYVAIEFYRNLGFVFRKRIPLYYGNEDAIVMVRVPMKHSRSSQNPHIAEH